MDLFKLAVAEISAPVRNVPFCLKSCRCMALLCLGSFQKPVLQDPRGSQGFQVHKVRFLAHIIISLPFQFPLLITMQCVFVRLSTTMQCVFVTALSRTMQFTFVHIHSEKNV